MSILTPEIIQQLYQESLSIALKKAGTFIGNGDVAAMNQPAVFARSIEQLVLAKADQAKQTIEKIAPVQGYTPGIPWSLHIEAYDAYCKKYGAQPAMIDLEGRNCRGGFGVGELDVFVPGWRDRVSEIAKLKARVAELEEKLMFMQADLDGRALQSPAPVSETPSQPLDAKDCPRCGNRALTIYSDKALFGAQGWTTDCSSCVHAPRVTRFSKEESIAAWHKCVGSSQPTLAAPPHSEQQEPIVHILPSDLERMRRTETTAMVASVAFANPNEKSVPLYTADQVQPAPQPSQEQVRDWQTQAIAWLRGKAAYQAQVNEQYPRHAACYPTWTDYVTFAQRLANELEHETKTGVQSQPKQSTGSEG